MHPPAQATRRAQVVAALADAVAAADRPPPVHVAVDGCFLQHPGVRGRLGPGRVPAFGPSAGPRAVRGPRPGPAAPGTSPRWTPVDGAFAAGLLPHLPDPASGLAELARVVRPGGRLVLFHPSGRAALAARHGRRPRDDDLLAPGPLGHQLRSTGWRPARYDDGPDRFLTVAERTSPTVSGRRPGRS
jgi:SAM-dependent methyltransferase